ncbi:phosphate/phosphite/phosphonate ABC transporter substrate-binding protein [Bdellovibrio sp. ZAP7]|uniref:phosphate/phosphite/phosphonate ABC transporter substrate-binding protein n=1 Tax=Bdellovibrio sp. ZAP7 TaxID=2231053 RepID=UPI001FEEFB9E|nr:phosphate/phosphite/phosphonate ABC transporter substrate-binding protein [Bdellovibrio sp. ZAP7]
MISFPRTFTKVISGVLAIVALSASVAMAADKIPAQMTIGMIPGGDPKKESEQGIALAQALQTRLGIPVNMYISKNYAGLVEAMKNKKVDFAFFSSSTYVFAEKQAAAKVLLKKVWQEPYYYSAIIVPTSSKIKKLEDLKGKKVAFVDEQSSSGYLYPKMALRNKKIEDKDIKVQFTGNHQASIKALESKEVDAAAVFSDDEKGKQGAWVKFGDPKTKMRILWMSSPIPNDPFCVRQDFYDEYPKVTHDMMFALIDILEQSADKNTYSEILGSRDLMPATSKQYDPVREMVKALNIELKP